jgi:hypothetical protein
MKRHSLIAVIKAKTMSLRREETAGTPIIDRHIRK